MIAHDPRHRPQETASLLVGYLGDRLPVRRTDVRARLNAFAQYRKQNLVECYGADIRLPDLRERIAQCEHRGMHDARMCHFLDLVTKAVHWKTTATASATTATRAIDGTF